MRLFRELGRIARAEEKRHARLRDRLATAFATTLVVFAVGTVLVYVFERHAKNTDVRTFGDAAFFTAVQLLTISSQLKNPLTTGGRIVDVCLEAYALVVVTSVAGIFAAFFRAGDGAGKT
jgi:hypothetical protein